MGVDHTGKSADSNAEKTKKPPADNAPPPDKPGSTGQPSRLESKAAAARPESATEQPDEREDEQTPPVGEKPDATSQEKPGEEPEQDTADRGSVTEADDRSPEDLGRQSDTDAGETDDPPTEDRPGPEQPAWATEADSQGEPGEGTDTDSEGESKSPSGNEVWDEFASKPASYELDGRQFGYRTWGDEFAARRASREAAGQTGSTEARDESPVQDEAPAEGKQNAADEGTAGPATAPDAENKAGEEDDPEPRGDVADQNEAWRDHTETMRTKWADLESDLASDGPPGKNDQGEGAPDETTSEKSRDISADEPGSWRSGDSNGYLNNEENYAVDRSFERVRDQETDITDSLKMREADVTDAKLVGLEYRLKGEDRFKEKAAEKLSAELRKSPTEAAESVPDGLRYTYQIPGDSYVQGYRQMVGGLQKDGYELVLCRNSWGGAEYKGVNTRWRSPSGQLFEIQFHTPESFGAKQLTHVAYERQRNPLTSGQERVKLKEFQREVSAGIPIPSRATDIADYRKEGY